MTGMGGRPTAKITDLYWGPKGSDTKTRRTLAILALESLGENRKPTLHAMENVPLFDAKPTNETILEIVVRAFHEVGDKIDPTVGAVRDSLGMLPQQFHDAFCRCKNGTDMSGHQAAAYLRALDDQTT